MRNVKLSLRKYQLITEGIPRKQHNRRFCHQYLTVQQNQQRDSKDTWETWGEMTTKKYFDTIKAKKDLKSALDK